MKGVTSREEVKSFHGAMVVADCNNTGYNQLRVARTFSRNRKYRKYAIAS